MPRFATIDPASAPVKTIFDGPLKGKHFNLFKGLANSPAALNAYLAFSGALANGALSAKEREVIALAVAEANNCGYCAAAHTVIGKGSGLTEAQTVEARRGTLADPKLNALLKFTLALHEKRGFIADGDFAAAKAAGYTDGQLAEAIGNYGLNIFTNYFNHANGTVIDFPTPPSI